jgi:hypothetical protein
MGLRPRLLVTVFVVLAAVLAATGVASSRSAQPVEVRGAVTLVGGVMSAPGWTVAHPATGIYELTGPSGAQVLDVPTWDTPADVTILPAGGGASEVRFALDGEPVDTAFSFVGLARH